MGLGLIFRHLSLEEIKIVSRLEEEFQVEVWGVVEGGILNPSTRHILNVTIAFYTISRSTVQKCY